MSPSQIFVTWQICHRVSHSQKSLTELNPTTIAPSTGCNSQFTPVASLCSSAVCQKPNLLLMFIVLELYMKPCLIYTDRHSYLAMKQHMPTYTLSIPVHLMHTANNVSHTLKNIHNHNYIIKTINKRACQLQYAGFTHSIYTFLKILFYVYY